METEGIDNKSLYSYDPRIKGFIKSIQDIDQKTYEKVSAFLRALERNFTKNPI